MFPVSNPRRNVTGDISCFTVTYVDVPGNLTSRSLQPSCPLSQTKQIRLFEKQELEAWQRRQNVLVRQWGRRLDFRGNPVSSVFSPKFSPRCASHQPLVGCGRTKDVVLWPMEGLKSQSQIFYSNDSTRSCVE